MKHIAQVWFSSVWNTHTLQVFRSAIEACLQDQREDMVATNVLQYWLNSRPISQTKARTEWLHLHSMEENLFHTVPNLINSDDRVRVAHYLMTGELFIDSGSLVGNVMLFTDYPQFNTRVSNVSVLSRTPIVELIQNAAHGTSFWTLIENYLLNGITRLKALIYQEHRLQVQVLLGMIQSTNPALIDRIRALCPTSISWSNIVDYIAPDRFHQLAKYLSNTKTVHHGYSLNHSHRVFGTHLCDFRGQAQRQRILIEAKRECQNLVHEYDSIGARCLRSNDEPISDYRNIACYYLARKYGVDSWLKNHFCQADVQIDRHELEPYSTFSETGITYHLTWRYPILETKL